MKLKKLEGVFTALVTPFDGQGEFDQGTFRALVQRQLEAGVAGLVPCGTTGETPALTEREWERVIATTLEVAGGRVPVIPGTGSNNTAQTIERTRIVRELGADAALVVTPYYNKPNPSGLMAHYRAICAEALLPVVVYNVPSRTGLHLSAEQMLALADIEGVIAIKEASGNLSQAMTILSSRPQGLSLLSGEDELTCPMVLMGGDGVISVVSNVDPEGTVRMVRAALDGHTDEARREHYRLLRLTRALFAETNPVPAKAALAELGLMSHRVRPPLAPASAATVEQLRDGLRAAGLN